MASIRLEAQYVLTEARDGIAWIALWHSNRSWHTMTFWPDYEEKTGCFVFEDFEREQLQNIAKIDPRAILVNSYYHNLGDPETMTRNSLAEALRWQYNLQHYLATDAVHCDVHV